MPDRRALFNAMNAWNAGRADSASGASSVLGLILAGGIYFAYMLIFNRRVLDTEPGEDIFAATPEAIT